jgi:DMSO/TMAO reductase YedYZ molybdopterin-dependent catalytic subunit
MDECEHPEGPAPIPHRRRRGAVAGLVATAVALGVAELTRAIDRRLSSPVVDVGARFIDATPRWLKDLAIRWFGTADKVALIVGIVVLLGLYAVLIGIVATRRRWVGIGGVALFALVGMAASATAVGPWWSLLPSLAGGLAGGATLWYLLDRAGAAPVDRRRPDVARGVPAPVGVARRSFLVAASALTGVAVVAAATGRALSQRFDVAAIRERIRLPRARRPLPEVPAGVQLDVEGITPFVTPNADFYRIDTALVAPQVPTDTWTLRVTGSVDRELELSYDDLLGRDLVEADITLTCVSNEVGGQLAGTARWLGVPLAELLAEAGVQPDADQIVGRSTDGFTSGFPVEFGTEPARGALVAVGMNGEPLPVVHGFPARLVVPGLYGSVSATKWLTEIELTRFDRFDAYWAARDWAPLAPIKTFSRIDSPRPLQRIAAGPRAIAGVAWAQTVGIDRVEVRVDGGEWMPAQLADELNDVTWRQWMLPYEFTEPGSHTIECRATDRNGDIQTEDRSEPFPDGATGWHSLVTLVS